MLKSFTRWMMLLGIGVALSGCQFSGTSSVPTPMTAEDSAFATAVPIREMNTKLRLRLATELSNELKVNTGITLILENLSQESIVFSGSYGRRLFVYSGFKTGWVEIQDRGIDPRMNIILDPKGGDFSLQVVEAWPALVDTGKPVTVRILVSGKVIQFGFSTNEEVGAYTDVTLNP
jgi:hypothetical protein